MPARDHATPPQRMMVTLSRVLLDRHFLNQGLCLDQTDISSRRRLRAQDVTDRDEDFNGNAEVATAAPPAAVAGSSLAFAARSETCRAGTLKRPVAGRNSRLKTEEHPGVVNLMDEIASLWFELEDRSKPSISSF
jgi:hypothetical protein